jgi:hypothetical protein
MREELGAPRLDELARLDDGGFRKLFAGSPIKRTGRNRFLRNVLIAIGNSDDRALAETAEQLLRDGSPLVRGAAVWALGRLDRERLAQLAPSLRPMESDPVVQDEWAAMLGPEHLHAPSTTLAPQGRIILLSQIATPNRDKNQIFGEIPFSTWRLTWLTKFQRVKRGLSVMSRRWRVW